MLLPALKYRWALLLGFKAALALICDTTPEGAPTDFTALKKRPELERLLQL